MVPLGVFMLTLLVLFALFQVQCSVDHILHHGAGNPSALELLHNRNHGNANAHGHTARCLNQLGGAGRL
uniref:Secreted protein n=1 Tax=Anguilla anguilla TaxID=7936 RepID=A0A0E9SC38_ANGAN